MSTKNLSSLFRPESVAVIGATNKEGRIGNLVMNNCMDASRNARTDFTVTARQIAVLYPACRCGALCPLALMESADPRLISLVDFSPN